MNVVFASKNLERTEELLFSYMYSEKIRRLYMLKGLDHTFPKYRYSIETYYDEDANNA
jgi:hypothetical protein